MSTGRLSIRQRIATFLLLAIACRSLVAIGWMLELPSNDGVGFAFPSVVICPQQSPELAAWLRSEGHDHHHHGDPSDADGGISLSVLDPTCGAWTGSALANLPTSTAVNLVYRNEIYVKPQSYSRSGRLITRSFSARAPPAFS